MCIRDRLLDDDRPVDGENKPAVAGAVARRFFCFGKKAPYFFRSGSFSEMVVFCENGTIFWYFMVVFQRISTVF